LIWPFKKKEQQSTLTDASLVEIAQSFSEELIPFTTDSAVQIHKLMFGDEAPPRQDVIISLSLEVTLFWLHLMDREIFGRLGPNRRDVFMNALRWGARENLMRQYGISAESEAAKFRDRFVDSFNLRQEFYSKFKKSVPQGNEGYEGTLFWEFGVSIVSVYMKNMNPVAAGFVSAIAMDIYVVMVKTLNHVGL
jgi:hypothetical protein